MSKKVSVGNFLAILSGIIVIASLFFPWVKKGEISDTGFAVFGNAKVLLISGIVVIIFGFLSYIIKKNLGIIYLVALVLNIVLLIHIYYIAREKLPELPEAKFMQTPDAATGFYICAAGTLILLLSAIFVTERRKKKE